MNYWQIKYSDIANCIQNSFDGPDIYLNDSKLLKDQRTFYE